MLIARTVPIVLDNTTVYHKFVQGVVFVTRSWCSGNDVGENLLDAKVAVVEGIAIGEGTKDVLSSLIVPNVLGADKVPQDSR